MSALTTLLKFQPCRHMTPFMMMQATRQMSFGPATRYQVTRLFPRHSSLSLTRLPSLPFNPSRTFSSSPRTWNEVYANGPPRVHTPSRTVYVGNLPYTASTEEVEDMFSSFGKIENVRMKYDEEQGKNLGYAHIDFLIESDAAAAVASAQEEPFWLTNRTLMVNFSRPPQNKKTRTQPPTPSNTLFFNKFDGTTNDLREGLEKYAKSIVRIDFHKDRKSGEPLNRGHIRFTSEETASSVLDEMNGSVTDSGSTLHLEYSYQKSKEY